MLDSGVSGHSGQQGLLHDSRGGSQVSPLSCAAGDQYPVSIPSQPRAEPRPQLWPRGTCLPRTLLAPASSVAVGPAVLLPVGSLLALEHAQNLPPLGSSCLLPSRPGPPLLASVGLSSPGMLQGLVPDPSSPSPEVSPMTRTLGPAVTLALWGFPTGLPLHPGRGASRG